MGNSSSNAPPTPVAEAPKAQGARRRRGSVSAEADKSRTPYVKKKVAKTAAERAFLKKSVSSIFMFADLPASLLDEVLDAMEKRSTSPQQVIIEQGGEGDNFYVIEKGDYRVVKNGKQVLELHGAGFFGELALMYNAKRAATVEATSAGVIWALDRVSFRHILTSSQQQRVKVSIESLAKVAILQSLSAADRTKLCDALHAHEFADGATIIQQGDYATSMFIVEEGAALVYVTKPNAAGKAERVQVNTHGAGDYFGERALITNEPRAATVIAKGPTKAWSIDRDAFERLLGSGIKKEMTARAAAYAKANATRFAA